MLSKMDTANAEKSKRKKKRERERDQQECVESSEVQNEPEKQHRKHKKKKKNKEMNDRNDSVQIPTEKKKKKRRKLNEGVLNETLMDDGLTAEVQVREKKKKKRKHTECDDRESHHVSTQQENMTYEDDQITDLEASQKTSEDLMNPDIQMGSAKRKRKRKTNGDQFIEIDPKLLNELKEFVPDADLRSKEIVHKMIYYDLPRFKEFRRQGISIRHGRFSVEENMRLRQNVRDFLALSGVQNPTKLFHTRRFPQEKQELTKLKILYKFYERIAEGIPRSCRLVFCRGRKAFDGDNYKGRFTKEEVKTLLKFQTIHGNNWQKISELTGRSAYSLEKRFTQISKRSGLWSEKEMQRLLKAVRDHIVTTLKSTNKKTPTRVSREMLYRNLPWFKIAAKVKTRCWNKCRGKWMSILPVRMSSGTVYEGRKSQEGRIRLIKAMYEMQVDDAALVNWEDLTAVFGDVPPAHVQLKWHQLKVCYVPNWQNKCFGDIVDFLYEKILPRLKKDCEDLDEDELKVDQQQSFLLSDIFQGIKDNCDDDDGDEDEEGSKQIE